jgi:hypothetical protein
MLRNPRVQSTAVLATGVLLGYLAASGNWHVFPKVRATTRSETVPTRMQVDAIASSWPACCAAPAQPELLALAVHNEAGAAKDRLAD